MMKRPQQQFQSPPSYRGGAVPAPAPAPSTAATPVVVVGTNNSTNHAASPRISMMKMMPNVQVGKNTNNNINNTNNNNTNNNKAPHPVHNNNTNKNRNTNNSNTNAHNGGGAGAKMPPRAAANTMRPPNANTNHANNNNNHGHHHANNSAPSVSVGVNVHTNNNKHFNAVPPTAKGNAGMRPNFAPAHHRPKQQQNNNTNTNSNANININTNNNTNTPNTVNANANNNAKVVVPFVVPAVTAASTLPVARPSHQVLLIKPLPAFLTEDGDLLNLAKTFVMNPSAATAQETAAAISNTHYNYLPFAAKVVRNTVLSAVAAPQIAARIAAQLKASKAHKANGGGGGGSAAAAALVEAAIKEEADAAATATAATATNDKTGAVTVEQEEERTFLPARQAFCEEGYGFLLFATEEAGLTYLRAVHEATAAAALAAANKKAGEAQPPARHPLGAGMRPHAVAAVRKNYDAITAIRSELYADADAAAAAEKEKKRIAAGGDVDAVVDGAAAAIAAAAAAEESNTNALTAAALDAMDAEDDEQQPALVRTYSYTSSLSSSSCDSATSFDSDSTDGSGDFDDVASMCESIDGDDDDNLKTHKKRGYNATAADHNHHDGGDNGGDCADCAHCTQHRRLYRIYYRAKMNRAMETAHVRCPIVSVMGAMSSSDSGSSGDESTGSTQTYRSHFSNGASGGGSSPNALLSASRDHIAKMRKLFNNCFFNTTITPAAIDGTVNAKPRAKAIPLKGTAFGNKTRASKLVSRGELSVAAAADGAVAVDGGAAAPKVSGFVHLPSSSIEAAGAMARGLKRGLPNIPMREKRQFNNNKTGADADADAAEGGAAEATEAAAATVVVVPVAPVATPAQRFVEAAVASPLFNKATVRIHKPLIIDASSSSAAAPAPAPAPAATATATAAAVVPATVGGGNLEVLAAAPAASDEKEGIVVNFSEAFEQSMVLLLKRNAATHANTACYKAESALPLAARHHTHHRHCVMHRALAAAKRMENRKLKSIRAKANRDRAQRNTVVNATVFLPCGAAAAAAIAAVPSAAAAIAVGGSPCGSINNNNGNNKSLHRRVASPSSSSSSGCDSALATISNNTAVGAYALPPPAYGSHYNSDSNDGRNHNNNDSAAHSDDDEFFCGVAMSSVPMVVMSMGMSAPSMMTMAMGAAPVNTSSDNAAGGITSSSGSSSSGAVDTNNANNNRVAIHQHHPYPIVASSSCGAPYDHTNTLISAIYQQPPQQQQYAGSTAAAASPHHNHHRLCSSSSTSNNVVVVDYSNTYAIGDFIAAAGSSTSCGDATMSNAALSCAFDGHHGDDYTAVACDDYDEGFIPPHVAAAKALDPANSLFAIPTAAPLHSSCYVDAATNAVRSPTPAFFRYNPYGMSGFRAVMEAKEEAMAAVDTTSPASSFATVPAAAAVAGGDVVDEYGSCVSVRTAYASHHAGEEEEASAAPSRLVPVSEDPAAAAAAGGYGIASYLPSWVAQPSTIMSTTVVAQYVGGATEASARLKNMLKMSKVKRF